MFRRSLLIFAVVVLCPQAVRIRWFQKNVNSSVEEVPRGMHAADTESANPKQTINFEDDEPPWTIGFEPLTELARSSNDAQKERSADALATPVLNDDGLVASRTASIFEPSSELARSDKDAKNEEVADTLWKVRLSAGNQVKSNVTARDQSALVHVSTKRRRSSAWIEHIAHHAGCYVFGSGLLIGWLSCCCLWQWWDWLHQRQEHSHVMRGALSVVSDDTPSWEVADFASQKPALVFKRVRKKMSGLFKTVSESSITQSEQDPSSPSPSPSGGGFPRRARRKLSSRVRFFPNEVGSPDTAGECTDH